MADKTRDPRDVPTVFVIPEVAHFDLMKLREHVRMMARLSEPGVVAPYGCVVHPYAMHFSYMTIWRTLNESIDATYWSADRMRWICIRRPIRRTRVLVL